MIASLPMYMRPENKDAHDRYWQLIADILTKSGIVAPTDLDAYEDNDHWLRDDLVLSQTCGMPYRLFLHGKVQLIGTPDYGLPDCDAGYYNSIFIINAQDTRMKLADFASANLAITSKTSQSGYAAPLNEAAKAGFHFETQTLSGGHVNSAKMVATGEVDITAVDAMTWHNIRKYGDFAGQLKVIAQTDPTPGLPYICALGLDKAVIAQAVTDAIDALSNEDRACLNIRGLIQIPSIEYLAVENP
ncbi:MAG: PhnD/SsuA/transferrin family substrate-binding protein [Amylibacter sp.]